MLFKKPPRERCSGCGAPIDPRKAFRTDRGDALWCSDCYLIHDVRGRRYADLRRSEETVYVTRPPRR
jgi:hypothetical protein